MTVKELICEIQKYPNDMEVRMKDTKTTLFPKVDKVVKWNGIECVYLLPENFEEPLTT
jgi:hypothetical protein